MPFEEALNKIKNDITLGMRLPNMSPETVVCVYYPGNTQKIGNFCDMSSPYLYIANRFGKAPWVPTFTDMFSDRWEVCANCQRECEEVKKHDNNS